MPVQHMAEAVFEGMAQSDQMLVHMLLGDRERDYSGVSLPSLELDKGARWSMSRSVNIGIFVHRSATIDLHHLDRGHTSP